jgi:hypothetical protein
MLIGIWTEAAMRRKPWSTTPRVTFRRCSGHDVRRRSIPDRGHGLPRALVPVEVAVEGAFQGLGLTPRAEKEAAGSRSRPTCRESAYIFGLFRRSVRRKAKGS